MQDHEHKLTLQLKMCTYYALINLSSLCMTCSCTKSPAAIPLPLLCTQTHGPCPGQPPANKDVVCPIYGKHKKSAYKLIKELVHRLA